MISHTNKYKHMTKNVQSISYFLTSLLLNDLIISNIKGTRNEKILYSLLWKMASIMVFYIKSSFKEAVPLSL